jgi:hypothetical protein
MNYFALKDLAETFLEELILLHHGQAIEAKNETMLNKETFNPNYALEKTRTCNTFIMNILYKLC